MDLYSFLEPLSVKMTEILDLVDIALSEGDEKEATKLMLEAKKLDRVKQDIFKAMRDKFGEKMLSEETKQVLETMGKAPDKEEDMGQAMESAGFPSPLQRGAKTMLNRLLKLANKLDGAGYYEEASAIDDIIRAVAVGEDTGDMPEMPPSPAPGASSAPMSEAEMRAEMERLRKENEMLKLKKQQKGSMLKVTPKGGVSLYGIGRWPATFYKSQWIYLLNKKEEILKFLADNDSRLSSKSEE